VSACLAMFACSVVLHVYSFVCVWCAHVLFTALFTDNNRKPSSVTVELLTVTCVWLGLQQIHNHCESRGELLTFDKLLCFTINI